MLEDSWDRFFSLDTILASPEARSLGFTALNTVMVGVRDYRFQACIPNTLVVEEYEWSHI